MPQGTSHCIHGHEFTPENTYTRMDLGTPIRVCRACVKRRSWERWCRIKAERSSPDCNVYPQLRCQTGNQRLGDQPQAGA